MVSLGRKSLEGAAIRPSASRALPRSIVFTRNDAAAGGGAAATGGGAAGTGAPGVPTSDRWQETKARQARIENAKSGKKRIDVASSATRSSVFLAFAQVG